MYYFSHEIADQVQSFKNSIFFENDQINHSINRLEVITPFLQGLLREQANNYSRTQVLYPNFGFQK